MAVAPKPSDRSSSRSPDRAAALAALLVTGLLVPLAWAVPAAAEAAPLGAGTLVGPADPDFAQATLPAPPHGYCFRDADGNGARAAGEEVYLRFGPCDGLSPGDVALSDGFRLVRSAEAAPLLPLDAATRFFDADGNGFLGRSDTLYLAGAGWEARIGDVRLTALGSLPAGRSLQATDPEPALAYVASPHGHVCLRDLDGDGAADPSETLYLQPSCGAVPGGALRLVAGGGEPGGTRVLPTQADAGAMTVPLPAMSCRIRGGGSVVLQLATPCGPDSGPTAGDVPLSGPTSFSRLGDGDARVGQPTDPFGATGGVRYLDLDGDAVAGLDEPLYLPAWGFAPVPSIGDVRLTPFGALPAADHVSLGEPEAAVVYASLPLHACFADGNGDGRAQGSEAIYLQVEPCGAVAAQDVRLSRGPHAPGRFVQPADLDAGAATLPLPAATAFAFHDADGNGAYGPSDPVYLDLGNRKVSPGDVALAGLKRVGSSTPGLNNDLVELADAGQLAYYDSDGDAVLSGTDVVYVRMPGFAAPIVGDIRLTPFPGFAAGSRVGVTDPETSYFLVTSHHGAVCFVDRNGDADRDLAEPLYLSRGFCDLGVMNGDLRLVVDSDADGDTVTDPLDNCPARANATQKDIDGDGLGDACDADDDGDGAPDAADNCRFAANPLQGDFNGDGQGDACDDSDGDRVKDDADNCRLAPNRSQADFNGDAEGDACDDSDGDGAFDAADNCRLRANAAQRDGDGDGRGDACDRPAVTFADDHGAGTVTVVAAEAGLRWQDLAVTGCSVGGGDVVEAGDALTACSGAVRVRHLPGNYLLHSAAFA